MTSSEIKQLLESNPPFDYGATSDVYKVTNTIENKGFLCLKIMKLYLFKNSTQKDEEEEDDDDNKSEEIEINSDLSQSLYKEYEIVNNLNHPNIVKTHSEKLFIIIKY